MLIVLPLQEAEAGGSLKVKSSKQTGQHGETLSLLIYILVYIYYIYIFFSIYRYIY